MCGSMMDEPATKRLRNIISSWLTPPTNVLIAAVRGSGDIVYFEIDGDGIVVEVEAARLIVARVNCLSLC